MQTATCVNEFVSVTLVQRHIDNLQSHTVHADNGSGRDNRGSYSKEESCTNMLRAVLYINAVDSPYVLKMAKHCCHIFKALLPYKG